MSEGRARERENEELSERERENECISLNPTIIKMPSFPCEKKEREKEAHTIDFVFTAGKKAESSRKPEPNNFGTNQLPISLRNENEFTILCECILSVKMCVCTHDCVRVSVCVCV